MQNYTDFKQSTVVLQQGPNGAYPLRGKGGQLLTQKDGFEKLTHAMAPYVHAVPKSVLNLPEPIVTEVPVTLSAAERKAYTLMETKLRVELTDAEGNLTEANATIVLTKILRLTQIAAGHVTLETGEPHDAAPASSTTAWNSSPSARRRRSSSPAASVGISPGWLRHSAKLADRSA